LYEFTPFIQIGKCNIPFVPEEAGSGIYVLLSWHDIHKMQ
jgi:hypothetical protein